MRILAATGAWMTRRELRDRNLNDRQCRLAREHAHGRILAGSKGYRMMRFATPEEIRRSLALRKAQIDTETRNYLQEMRRAHTALAKAGQT